MSDQKAAVLFPGQGAFSGAALKDVAAEYPQIAQTLAEIDAVAKPQLGVSLTETLLGEKAPNIEELMKGSPDVLQLAIYATSIGLHRILEAYGFRPTVVVGHSLGGLISRYYVQRLGGDRRVESLVTLGTPHHGSVWAHVGPTPLIRQLRPGSPVIRELEEPAPDCRTPVTAIYSDLDQMVVPSAAGRCEHPDLRARNVLVRGVGHMSLPIHRAVVDEVAATRVRTLFTAYGCCEVTDPIGELEALGLLDLDDLDHHLDEENPS